MWTLAVVAIYRVEVVQASVGTPDRKTGVLPSYMLFMLKEETL